MQLFGLNHYKHMLDISRQQSRKIGSNKHAFMSIPIGTL
jgi:hypothetical protein